MPKIFKIQGYFIDPIDDYTAEELKILLEENYSIISHHIKVEEQDIGEWEDDNPLNYHNCPESECEKYFKGESKMTKCQHIENDPKTLDPCIYEEIEVHKNVTVRVNKCKNCGHIEYRWERQPDTISEYRED